MSTRLLSRTSSPARATTGSGDHTGHLAARDPDSACRVKPPIERKWLHHNNFTLTMTEVTLPFIYYLYVLLVEVTGL